jgi:hypothetical protein
MSWRADLRDFSVKWGQAGAGCGLPGAASVGESRERRAVPILMRRARIAPALALQAPGKRVRYGCRDAGAPGFPVHIRDFKRVEKHKKGILNDREDVKLPPRRLLISPEASAGIRAGQQMVVRTAPGAGKTETGSCQLIRAAARAFSAHPESRIHNVTGTAQPRSKSPARGFDC